VAWRLLSQHLEVLRHGWLRVTELVAAAIANADAQAALTASRARIVAAADAARHRIQRDLHDGAQQRLVTLALQLRAAQSAVPPDAGDLATELERLAEGLSAAHDELREIARGIHPVALAKAGLASALTGLGAAPPCPCTSTSVSTLGSPNRSSSPPTTSWPRHSRTLRSMPTPTASTSG
jgi:signal transduction histidine kinase